MASYNNTFLTGNGSSLTDVFGTVWGLENGQVTVNGTADPTTGNVIALAYVNGLVWQENAGYLWWSKIQPSDSWSPESGTATDPLPAVLNPAAANNTVATYVGQKIIDANHNTWAISNTGQVLINGAPDPTTGQVVKLAYENGAVWQENAAGLWWAKSQPTDTWSPQDGTAVSPIPAGSTPVAAPFMTRSWVGLDGDAAADPNNWSPVGAPQPGDVLSDSVGATININGDDLAGDTLTVTGSPNAVVLNAADNAELNVVLEKTSANFLLVSGTATVNLGGYETSLETYGGTIQFVGTSNLGAGSYTFQSELTGPGTLNLGGGQGEGNSTEIGGKVDHGLVVTLGGVTSLQIDHPDQFAGTLDFSSGTPLHNVLLAGLTATSSTLAGATLDLFNGSTVVDSIRVAGSTGDLTLGQTSSGVVIGEIGGSLAGPGGTPVTPIPLSIIG